MPKNLSNPLNARKVASILQEDAASSGYQLDDRKISVFLSDNRISDLEHGLKQLKQANVIPIDYFVSEAAQTILLEEDFIASGQQITKESIEENTVDINQILGIDTTSQEFTTQYRSFKEKLLKSRSGGLNIEGQELENFDRKFARPMKYFTEYMQERGISVTELQSFTSVYATDFLSLGDSSKEDVFELTFNRFDAIRQELSSEFGLEYEWPSISGTTFIEFGKKYSIHSEIADFARKFRSLSGLDTYSDDVVKLFFAELIMGNYFAEMIDKRIIYRWRSPNDDTSDYTKYLLPPPTFNLEASLRDFLQQVVVAHIIVTKIQSDPPTFLSLLREMHQSSAHERVARLAEMIEAALSRKSVSFQYGTTLANFFENLKSDPSKIPPFLDTTLRYFKKSDSIYSMIMTTEHSIRTALKNSTGLLKVYLGNLSDEDLNTQIQINLQKSVDAAVSSHLSELLTYDGVESPSHQDIDTALASCNDVVVKSFFADLLHHAFINISQFTKDLEPEKAEPISKEGGLTELTKDFTSTAMYHGSKNPQTASVIERLHSTGLPYDICVLLANISSYLTYQVGSKEGEIGEVLHWDIAHHYGIKYHHLAKMLQVEVNEEISMYLLEFLFKELQQAHVLISLGSKLKTDAYNTWTPLETLSLKHTQYLNDFILPNMYFWQRLPRDFIAILQSLEYIDPSQVRQIVKLTGRLNMIEAYAILVIGASPKIKSFDEACKFLSDAFLVDVKSNRDHFSINPRSGEAQIAFEATYLWTVLQEVQ